MQNRRAQNHKGERETEKQEEYKRKKVIVFQENMNQRSILPLGQNLTSWNFSVKTGKIL